MNSSQPLLLALQPTSGLSGSIADHPLAYCICAGAIVALMLFVIFDANSSTRQSITWALFASPVSITLFAAVIGIALDQELPTIIAGNGIVVGNLSPHELAQYVGIGVGACTWLFLLSRWSTKRVRRKGPRVGAERPLSPETVARIEAAESFSKRHQRPTRSPNRLPKR